MVYCISVLTLTAAVVDRLGCPRLDALWFYLGTMTHAVNISIWYEVLFVDVACRHRCCCQLWSVEVMTRWKAAVAVVEANRANVSRHP